MADERVELEVGGAPVSSSNPMPTTPGAGADIGGGKTLADVLNELTTVAAAKTLADVITAVTGLEGGSNKTLSDLATAITALEGSGPKTLTDIVTALGFTKGAGAVDASTLRVVTSTDGPTVAALGATADGAVADAAGSINAHVRGTIAQLITMAGNKTLADIVTALAEIEIKNDTGNPIPVGGQLVIVTSEFARPGAGDVNPYIAKDVISTSTSAPAVATFTNVARVNAGSGYITKVRAMTDQKTNIARLRLHLYHTTPTAINDNAPYLLLWADRSKRVGVIDLPAMTSEDSTNSTAAYATNITDRMPFVCAAADRNLYAIVETLDAFTPASAQNFSFELTADLN